ncbi:MAG: M48 family metalloprotease [Acidobacteria bacterium]|nr:M48 family metalloprotease [Acidobacteriota bacterium]
MRRLTTLIALALLAWHAACAQQPAKRREPKPGFNLFSPQDDVQLGREAKAEIEKQMQVVRDREVDAYIGSIGKKLTSQPLAGDYPYSFQVVNQKTINAFALPGGPMFIHSGLIAAADNEAQIAGVMAHEIAHVALRHGTNQASKANLIQIPAMLAGSLAGRGMLGQLAQLGIGLGANSVLLKYSRAAEADADLVGARIMAGAGYNPLELARFFEKLQAEGGSGGRVAQFFSDHPNPGNRMAAIEEEVRYLPQKKYVTDTGKLQSVKAIVNRLPEPPKPRPAQGQAQGQAQSGGGPPPAVQPSGGVREYRGRGFTLSYPDNWETFEDPQSPSVTIAPRQGLVQGQNGNVAVGFGAILNVYTPRTGSADLERDTQDLVRQLTQSNSGLRVARAARSVSVDRRPAMVTTLSSPSPFQGEEVDLLVTVDRGGDLLYLVLVAPKSEYSRLEGTFNQMLQSLRIGR